MSTDPRWSALGAAIAAHRARHERESTLRIAESVLGHLSTLLYERPGAGEVLALLGAQLADVTLDDWSRVAMADAESALALRDVWKALDDAWHHGENEEGADGAPWAVMAESIDADLTAIRDELLRAADGCAEARTAIASYPPLSIWPLEHAGSARTLHDEALQAISERTGIPRDEMLDVSTIPDEPCFLVGFDALPLEDAGAVLARRRAWAMVLHTLRDHLAPLEQAIRSGS
ncbi:hypothetical protein [Sandaracinus amylolyticus]|uniref:Uncharacterized protein n=1 Tax=Sandaracinus amylolyticus TaxID=927083 RepID=A0A0F6WAK0_9BACT|nr:hypothetical protein [Sandaracinus amylolyticus]AKF11623.1 hypothetical protein DB32_008772 [Sandaracinus amylolyticus]